MPRGRVGKTTITEHNGFKVGDPVRLKITCIDPDHKGKIVSIRKDASTKEMVCLVEVKSCSCREGQGTWGPMFFNEIEKA